MIPALFTRMAHRPERVLNVGEHRRHNIGISNIAPEGFGFAARLLNEPAGLGDFIL
jgi:hypothetical protein